MLHYDPYERRSGLVRFLRAGHDARGVGDRPRPSSSATPSRAPSRSRRSSPTGWSRRARCAVSTGPDGPCRRCGWSRRSRSAATVASPTLTETVTVDEPVRRDGRGDPRARVDGRRCSAAAATRRPGGRSTASGRRTTASGPRPAQTGLAQGNDYVGIAIATAISPAGRRLVRAGRDDLELRGRLRARLPGRRAAADLAAVTGRRRVADGHRRAGGGDRARPGRGGARALPRDGAGGRPRRVTAGAAGSADADRIRRSGADRPNRRGCRRRSGPTDAAKDAEDDEA